MVGVLSPICQAQHSYPLQVSQPESIVALPPLETTQIPPAANNQYPLRTPRVAAVPNVLRSVKHQPGTLQQSVEFQPENSTTQQASLTNDPVNEAKNPFAKSFEAAYEPLITQPLPKLNPTMSSHGAANQTQWPINDVFQVQSDPRVARLNQPFSAPELPGSSNSVLSLNVPNEIVSENAVQPGLSEPTASMEAAANRSPAPVADFRGFADDESPDMKASWNVNMGGSSVWWRDLIHQPIHSPVAPQSIDSNSLVYKTLRCSPKIRALSQDPLIREMQIVEANSDFDAVQFVRSQFQDRVDPVGDSLSVTNDGTPFLQDHIWNADIGVRRKVSNGAIVELDQTLGFKNSNSNFFTPQDQGTATLALNVTQPLLRGRGQLINQSQILIAQSATGGAWNTFAGELQDEIQATVDGYWRLYYDRSVYLQKRRNVERGETILRTLEGRRELDSLPSQIARARSAVQSRKTDLANALRDIRDSETELRRLTADRDWQANQNIEMIPAETPNADAPKLALEQVVFTALEHRPEIKEAIARSKIAGIQRNISENDLLPELTLLMGTYVSALEGESRLGEAWGDQFGGVKPGYSVGIEFELPVQNRAARSRHAQRQLKLAKIKAEIDEVMQNVIAESQVSLRRVDSAKETMQAAHQAITAARADLEQNFRRWESFALVEGDIADGQTPTTMLDQLLDSQERLTSAELVFSQAELELKSAEVGLLRSMGTLLIHRDVQYLKAYQGDLPSLQIEQSNGNPDQLNGQPVYEEIIEEEAIHPSFGFQQPSSSGNVPVLKTGQAKKGLFNRIFK